MEGDFRVLLTKGWESDQKQIKKRVTPGSNSSVVDQCTYKAGKTEQTGQAGVFDFIISDKGIDYQRLPIQATL